ncbi:MAG: hypothetical protein FJZ01_05140 [Candidatus Sericytochromatia bacterium]|nr:hypothetical protein [Candidatus Tanganyikabacteria bacterium]
MWLFTAIGFFSVVAHRDSPESLLVRARACEDLAALRERYLPDLSPTEATPSADYPYRATVSRKAFGQALVWLATTIDYDNFKTRVAKAQGADRAHLYSEVWSVMRGLAPVLDG